MLPVVGKENQEELSAPNGTGGKEGVRAAEQFHPRFQKTEWKTGILPHVALDPESKTTREYVVEASSEWSPCPVFLLIL